MDIGYEIGKLINDIPNDAFKDNTIRKWIYDNWNVIKHFNNEEKDIVINNLFEVLKTKMYITLEREG